MSTYDVAIVGGGIFGCSVAKHLSERSDFNICLIEKEYHFAQHMSGRNSGTLHIGVVTEADIDPDSQLGRFTIGGTRRMKQYCMEHDLPISDRGIMKVANSPDEAAKVRRIYEQAAESDLDLTLLEDQEEIAEREPNIQGRMALYSPESATIDTVPITQQFAQEAVNNGVDLLMGQEVRQLDRTQNGIQIRTNKDDIRADYLVNTAGVKAVKLAKKLGLTHEYQSIPFRGVYFELTPEKRSLVNSNVYPTSIGDSFQVGVHFTRRPDGRVIVGPTGMIALGTETYGKTEFDLPEIAHTLTSRNFRKFIGSKDKLRIAWDELNKTYRKKEFLARCRKLISEVSGEDLYESYVGISHWLFDSDGERVGEPVIEFNDHSAHLLLPQPGFTSAIPLGEHIAEEVVERY